MRELAVFLIIIGVLIVLLGVILYLGPSFTKFFGGLPGDIKYETEKVKIYFPLTTMIIISVLLTILINVVLFVIKFLKR